MVLIVVEAVLVVVVTRQGASAARSELASQAQRPDDDPPAAEPEAAALAAEADPQPTTARAITPPPAVVPPPVNAPDSTIGGRSIFEGGGGGGGRPRTDEEQAGEAEAQRLLEEAVRASQEAAEADVWVDEVPPPREPLPERNDRLIDDMRLQEAEARAEVADAMLGRFRRDNQRIAAYVRLRKKIELYEQNSSNARIAEALKEARAELAEMKPFSDTEIAEYESQLAELRKEQRNARSALKALTAGAR